MVSESPENPQRIPRESPANPPACKSPPPGTFSSSQQTYRAVFYIMLFYVASFFTHECVPCRLGVHKKRSLPVQLWRVCRSLCPARAMVTVQLCASGARSFGKSVAASRSPQVSQIADRWKDLHTIPSKLLTDGRICTPDLPHC